MDIRLLDVDIVLENHALLIEQFGGAEGLRDYGLLESAVMGAAQTYGGQLLNSDIYEIAASYLFSLVNNHPFEDGNKRVGAFSALVFLDWNGVEVTATNDEIYDLTIAVAESRARKEDVADFFRLKSAS